MPAIVVGVVRVDMDVTDGLTPVSKVDASMQNVKHRVHVTNFSGHPLSAIVQSVLPRGSVSLEFDGSWLGPAAWVDIASRIPKRQARTLDCGLKRNGGAQSRDEPLQCDDLWVQMPIIPWNHTGPR